MTPLPNAAKTAGAQAAGRARESRVRRIGWTARARTTMGDAQRYSRFVVIMKRGLLLAAGALILAVLAYSLQPRDTGQYAVTFERLGNIANDLAMENPRLTGTDSGGNPFVITAEKAVQQPHDLNRAALSNVEADIAGAEGAWYDIRAPRGFLDSAARKLWLDGKVSLFSASGYELHTQSAFVDFAPACNAKKGRPPPRKPGKKQLACAKTTIRGKRPVTGQGPFGTLRADRFHVEKAAQKVFLDGNVRMTLYPASNAPKAKVSVKPARKS